MKDDAIAQLSDQVMALTARMHEFERKQPYHYPSFEQLVLGVLVNAEITKGRLLPNL
jgi:hypothetical protein